MLSVNVVRGILAIRGTPGNDVIEVRRAEADSSRIEVVENGVVTFSRPFAGLRQIRIDTAAGNDQAVVNAVNGGISLPTTISGGTGDDVMRGGAGVNTLNGGPGRDAFEPSGGRDRVLDGTRADKLVRAGSATTLRDYLAAAARGRSQFGMALAADNGIVRAVAQSSSAQPVMSATSNATVSSAGDAAGYSQTNTQVAGVDEGDIIENDGSHLYVLSGAQLVIIDARDPDAPAVASRTAVDGWPITEYLDGSRLTVLSSVWDDVSPPGADGGFVPMLRMRQPSQVQVTVYDVTDPTAPRAVSRTRIDGSYRDSRMIDGRLTLVVSNDLLGGYWNGGPFLVRPLAVAGTNAGNASSAGELAATSDASLVRLIRRSPVARMLPTWTTTIPQPQGKDRVSSGLISQPQDVLCPAVGTEANLSSIVMFDTSAAVPGIIGSASAIGGYTSTIHMDANDLYLFSPRWGAVSGDQTDVQRFAVSGAAPRLISTGTFTGSLLNQFSADAEGDVLRVAVTATRWNSSAPVQTSGDEGGDADVAVSWVAPWTIDRRNAVYVLATQGDTLRIIGSVDDIAPGESIRSARFIGEHAYLCTFLQVDPLFTIDLSSPTKPRITGELKVPGYSSFLMPYGPGYLVGMGRDADPATGTTRGLKVSLFDVRDDAAPTEVSSFVIDQPSVGWSWSDAEWDFHALGFFSDVGTIAIPVTGVRPGASDPNDPNVFVPWTTDYGVVVLRIDVAGGITRLGAIDHDASLLRTARIGDVLYSVAANELKAVTIGAESLTPRGTVRLSEPDSTASNQFVVCW